MSLTCRELVALITDYLEDRLGADERARFEEHLEGCDGCSNHLDQIRTTVRAVGSLREEHLSDGSREALLDAFRSWKRR